MGISLDLDKAVLSRIIEQEFEESVVKGFVVVGWILWSYLIYTLNSFCEALNLTI